MSAAYSYELTTFNLEGNIDLDEKCGLIKITKSDDDRLILVRDADYDRVDSETPKPLKFANVDSVLGFVLDIGIRREKQLTFGGGFYFGTQLIAKSQSERNISQTDFDGVLLEKIVSGVDSKFHSADPAEEAWGVKMRHLLDAYNQARLMYPNFYNDSYLSLMRILEALRNGRQGAYSFALWVTGVSVALNQEIYAKIPTHTLKVADDLFNDCLTHAQKSRDSSLNASAGLMQQLDLNGRFVFSCFYSAYKYRNMFVHQGLPFPQPIGNSTDYLGLSLGTSYPKYIRKDGVQDVDLVDFHDVIEESDKAEFLRFKEKYYQLLPTWHFMKRIAREALMNEIKKM